MDKERGTVGLVVGLIAIATIHFSVIELLSTLQFETQPWTGAVAVLVGVVGAGLGLASLIGSVRPNGVRGAGLILGAFVVAVASWELVASGGLPFGSFFITLLAELLAIGGGISLAHAVLTTRGTWWQQLPIRLLLPVGGVLPIMLYLVVGGFGISGIAIRGALRLALVSGLLDWFWSLLK
jgi:hypothetical protein